MTVHTFSAVIHQEGELYVVECPEVGTVARAPHWKRRSQI